MGGYHVTLLPGEARQEADAIVIGDAEPIWAQLLDDARRTVLRPEYDGLGRRVAHAVSALVARFRRKSYQNISLVEFARGCNFKCDFCAITAFHGASQNHRPANEVVAEMERIEVADSSLSTTTSSASRRRPANFAWNWPAKSSLGGPSQHPYRPRRRLLELMVGQRLLWPLDRHGIARPREFARHGQGLEFVAGSYAESLARFRKHGLAVYGTFVFGYDNDDAESIQRRSISPASRNYSSRRSIT